MQSCHLLTTSKHTCICILGARYTSTPASPTVHFYFFSELGAGRPVSVLVHKLFQCSPSFKQVSECICISNESEVTLTEYAKALPVHCRMNHSSDCKECFGFQSVTTSVLENGFLKLADAFHALDS